MLNREELLAAAREKTGLSDYGDELFMEPLQRLIDSLNTEAQMNEMGEYRARSNIMGGLITRLKVQDYIQRHPDVLDQVIERPVFIVGLPRTGTTALHHLLNEDVDNHTLRLWEAKRPVPPPEQATYYTDPRIEQEVKGVEMTEQFIPGFAATHLLDAEGPDECYLLFNRNFMSVEIPSQFHVPSYVRWLFAQDLSESYAYHKSQLQLLQYKKPGRWVLKAPFHQMGLASILEQYPDAIIVQQHRAPKSIIGSGCSFSEVLKKPCSDHVDPLIVGEEWMYMLETYTNTFEASREKLGPQFPHQFIDIDYREFVANPWPAVEAIYAKVGVELTEHARAAMQAWIDANPKDKRGKHEYSLDKFGITDADVDRVFSNYIKKYGLDTEVVK